MEKFVIGDKKFIGSQNEDLYIDIELMRQIETLKRDSLNNEFNFQDQYNLERNNSLKFCVYGIVESRYGNCDDLLMNITINNADTGITGSNEVIYTPYISTASTSGYSVNIISQPLSNGNVLSKNIYGTAKGSYFLLFEIDKNLFTKDSRGRNITKSINIEIFNPIKELFGSFTLPFLFFDEDGDQIEFGTENAEIDSNNIITEVNNNFPFFFDRHWIKFNIEPKGPQIVSFVKENDIVLEESNSYYDFEITLEEPSKFGLEAAKIVVDYGVDKYGIQYTSAQLALDYLFNEQIASWAPGELIKKVTIKIEDDLLIEPEIEKVVFRIVPISNVRISNSTNNSFTLNIESGDIPTTAYFLVPEFDIMEPSFNVSQSTPVNVAIKFSVPVPVAGEKLKISVNSDTTLVYATDFGFGQPGNFGPSELIIDIPQYSDSVSFQFTLMSNKEYDIERFIGFDLLKETPGITPVSQSTQTQSPKCKIKILDSMAYKYVRYIIPVDDSRGIGMYKTIYSNPQFTNQKVTKLYKDQFNPNASYTVNQFNVTNNFQCDLQVQNLGERIIWNGNYVLKNDTFLIPISFSSQTTDINIDLPTNKNYSYADNSYLQSDYKFRFTNVSRFIPSNLPPNQIGQSNANNYYDKNVEYQVETGGALGQIKRFLVTELKNVRTTYDENTLSCTIDAPYFTEFARYNGGILIAPALASSPVTHSTSKLIFSHQRVGHICQLSGSSLPVGVDFLPNGPFNERFIKLNLGKVWVQAGYSILNLNSDMYLGAITPQQQITNKHRYYMAFNNLPLGTQLTMELHISNKGDRDVTVAGKSIEYNTTTVYNSTEVDFNNLIIDLPANDEYVLNGNYFAKVSYHLAIKNIHIVNLSNTNQSQTVDIDLGLFQQASSSGNLMPIKFLQTEYRKVYLPATIFNISCTSPIFSASNYVLKPVLINGVLAQYDSSTVLNSVNFENSQVSPECPNATILYEITN